MTPKTAQTTKERAARARLRQIFNGSDGLLRANLVSMKRYCGTASCRCARGKRHWHASWYASQSQRGKIRMKSIPPQQLEDVRKWAEHYQEARRLLAVVGDEYWNKVGKKRKA
jgi:hypothetical protein